jgi:hypothetical protein
MVMPCMTTLARTSRVDGNGNCTVPSNKPYDSPTCNSASLRFVTNRTSKSSPTHARQQHNLVMHHIILLPCITNLSANIGC